MHGNYRNNVLGIVFNMLGQVLLVQYTSSGSRSFPKGGLEKEESFFDGIQREIYEELGIGKESLRCHFIYEEKYKKTFTSEEIQWKVTYKGEHFVGKVETICVLSYIGDLGDINTSVSAELSQHHWVALSELDTYITDSALLDMVDIQSLSKFISKLDK